MAGKISEDGTSYGFERVLTLKGTRFEIGLFDA